jgi:hypothetical protein
MPAAYREQLSATIRAETARLIEQGYPLDDPEFDRLNAGSPQARGFGAGANRDYPRRSPSSRSPSWMNFDHNSFSCSAVRPSASEKNRTSVE